MEGRRAATVFDQKYVLERYGEEKKEEGKKEGREEGREEGRLLEKKETAFTMHGKGYSESTIADILGVSVKKIREWAALDMRLPR